VEDTGVNNIHELADAIRQEISDIGDYIWKTPRFIENEYEIEAKKLSAYFPDDPELAGLRWKRETRKLDRVFPFLNATSNLFSATSVFEVYLLRIAKEVENTSSVQLKSFRGNGIQRVFAMLKDIGVELHKIELWPQINAALTIRNCLMHASGLLDWSRDEKEIRRIIKSSNFLSKDHRQRRRNLDRECDEVVIYQFDLGDRIEISNEYAHLVCFYYRDFFVELCEAVLNTEIYTQHQ